MVGASAKRAKLSHRCHHRLLDRQQLTDKTAIKAKKNLDCRGSNITAISILVIELTIAISITKLKKNDSSS